MSAKVWIIDSDKREIRAGTVRNLEDCQKIVGGLICFAHRLPNGDTLFVNDEGLLGQPQHFFYLKGAPNVFALNGYLIGPADDNGNDTDVQLPIETLQMLVKWLSPLEVALMYRRNR
jgi:hypothetical protein